MAKAYKNFWSINTDEAVVAGILRDSVSKKAEVFIPLNAQMKDVDLALMNMKSGRVLSIQVKGSKAYEPQKKQTRDYGDGSAGWFFFPRLRVDKSTADYFIFLIYVIEVSKKYGRRNIMPHTITLPTEKLRSLAKKNKRPHGSGNYSFMFWINPRTKKAFDFRDNKYDVSEYLDKKGFEKLQRGL